MVILYVYLSIVSVKQKHFFFCTDREIKKFRHMYEQKPSQMKEKTANTASSLTTGPRFFFPQQTHNVMIGYTPQTKTRQVYVVPKSVGLVTTDATLGPNPWGQKLPVWVGGLLKSLL
jgi:hypothetical protein